MIAGTYNVGLVVLSILIAVVASYAAFNLGERVSASAGQRRWIWLTSGAIAMGFAIWSMHYVGMLAFVLPVPVLYHVPTVIMSLIAAVPGAAVALYIVSKKAMRGVDTAIAGICLGAAVVAMHYAGMAAMRSAAMHHYRLNLVILSVVVAVTFSSLAAWLAFRFRRSHEGFTWTRLGGASLMGGGIASMHYTAMAAAYFMPGYAPLMRHTVEVSTLGAFGIGMTTLLLLGTVLVTLWLDRRLANERLLQSLYADLQKREAKIRRLVDANIIGIFIWNLEGRIIDANDAFLRIVGYDREEIVSGRIRWTELTPPEWRDRDERLWVPKLKMSGRLQPFEKEYFRKDGSCVPMLIGVASFEDSANEGVAFVLDLSEQKRVEESLRRSEAYLAEAQRLTKTGSWAHNPNTEKAIYWSEEMRRIFGLDPQKRNLPDTEELFRLVHPDDRDRFRERLDKAIREKADFVQDFRIVLSDGTIKHIHGIGHPVLDETGNIVEHVGTYVDVTEQHEASAALQTAFEQIKAEEAELRRMIDAIPVSVAVLRPDGGLIYVNQTAVDYTGVNAQDPREPRHPEDVERLREERQEALARGVPFENEQRVLGKDGKYRWFLVRYNPLRDDQGRIIRWYATGTDIDDRKRAEERIRDENVALREQIDQAFMFEEIVGSSPALQNVLSSIVKVAPTDSTVLITGETGTGKELIARAIHKHSQRSRRAFINVNCASIPSSLIASELFGHEKGAFTGALQRRQGRFELAHSGTIFLDEVGELPVEMQIALLRVLQERQFERVGGNQVLSTDVRVIAATNRDLTVAIAAGAFRADLFYRLNVFPIEVPPLRKRKEDVSMLVEYFVKRYAEKIGKQIRKIDKKTLELCQAYPWPGNIRELQNIVERSVILSSGDTFRIEKTWLASPEPARQELSNPLPDALQNQERKMIETALAECKGKIAGPEGAAAKLGIPRSTLDSKIKQLRIKRQNCVSEQ
jgi:PAS domain S-box-containing protein